MRGRWLNPPLGPPFSILFVWSDQPNYAEFTPHQLRLRVRDNGRGMPSGQPTGRGLRNMASRIREIGGSMTCRSVNGVELVFEVPLPVKFADPSPTAQQE